MVPSILNQLSMHYCLTINLKTFFATLLLCTLCWQAADAQNLLSPPYITVTGTSATKTFSVSGLPAFCSICTREMQYMYYWEFGDGNFYTVTGNNSTRVTYKYVANSPANGYVARVEVTPIKVGNGDDRSIKYLQTNVLINGLSTATNPVISNSNSFLLNRNRDIVPDKYVGFMVDFNNIALPLSPGYNGTQFAFSSISNVTISINNHNLGTFFDGLSQLYYYTPWGVRTSLIGDNYTSGNESDWDNVANTDSFLNLSASEFLKQFTSPVNFSALSHSNLFIKLKTKTGFTFNNSLVVRLRFCDNNNNNCSEKEVALRALTSYDPNAKTVAQQYLSAQNQIETLDYKIEVENIGQENVHRIIIIDPIPYQLNPSTLTLKKIVLGSFMVENPPISTNFDGNVTLTHIDNGNTMSVSVQSTMPLSDVWRLQLLNEDIVLLSAGTNNDICANGNKGYIEYSIATHPLACDPIDIFGTAASIIFDSNDTILTDPAYTTVACEPSCESIITIGAFTAGGTITYQAQQYIINQATTIVMPDNTRLLATAGNYIDITSAIGKSFDTGIAAQNKVATFSIEPCPDDPDVGSGKYAGPSISTANAIDRQQIDLKTYPNPFNNELHFAFELFNPDKLSLYLYNAQGQLIAIIANEQFYEIGEHQIDYTLPNHLPSGIYWCKLKTNNNVVTQKIMKL